MIFMLFDNKTRSGVSINEKLAEELHKQLIKNFTNERVYARLEYSIWAANLAKMRSLFSKNGNVMYLLYVIDVLTKYGWVKPLKYKRIKTVLNAIVEIVHESNCKPNKLWVDPGKKFDNKIMQ